MSSRNQPAIQSLSEEQALIIKKCLWLSRAVLKQNLIKITTPEDEKLLTDKNITEIIEKLGGE